MRGHNSTTLGAMPLHLSDTIYLSIKNQGKEEKKSIILINYLDK